MSKLGFLEKFVCIDAQLVENKNLNTDFTNNITLYEVLRIVSGKALFLDDHLARLNNSLKLTCGVQVTINSIEYYTRITELCKANHTYFGNIELRVIVEERGNLHTFIGFIPHTYPLPTDYISGVKTGILQIERDNPNAKVKNTQTRILADAYLSKTNLFEAVLVNRVGFITEGSRSNLFFIGNGKVFTAPLQYILPGITRKYAIQAIKTCNIPLIESLVPVIEIKNYQAAFICGTSPGILPVSGVDDTNFDSNNPILRQIMEAFNQIVANYLK